MHILVKKPELEKLIEDQVTSGRFRSAEDLVEAALQRLLQEEEPEEMLDADTLAAVRTSREQLDQGEGRDFKDALNQLRRKYEQQ
jgi:Arc/MetJ-type ribon-helix-helix transcriptional regulator